MNAIQINARISQNTIPDLEQTARQYLQNMN